jgi:hypothetical protein
MDNRKSYRGWTFLFRIQADALPLDCRDPIGVADKMEDKLQSEFDEACVIIPIQAAGGYQPLMLKPCVISPDGKRHYDSDEYRRMLAIWEAITTAGPDPDLG